MKLKVLACVLACWSGASMGATVAPGFASKVEMVAVTGPGRPRLVRARQVVGQDFLAEASRILSKRCSVVRRLIQLQDDPLGPDVIIYKADCDTGLFQVSVVGTRSYVKPWTGVLRD